VLTAKSIQSKLKTNNATIAKADKGSSPVILPTEKYESKVQNFINVYKFQKTDTDPTKTFSEPNQKTLKQSKFLIPSNSICKYTTLNPSPPTIKCLITKYNFFSSKQHTHVQTDGLAIGAPSSSNLSETFLQHIEHAHIPHLSMKHRPVNYF